MKLTRIILLIVIFIHTNAMSQENTITYLNITDSSLTFITKSFAEGTSKVVNKDIIFKSGGCYDISGEKFFYNIETLAKPEIEESAFHNKLNEFIEKNLCSDYEFTTYVYIIVTDKGEVEDVGIARSRGDYYYEMKIVDYIKTFHKWIPAIKNGKNVGSIRLLRVEVILK